MLSYRNGKMMPHAGNTAPRADKTTSQRNNANAQRCNDQKTPDIVRRK
jgi:hypothetical protein